MRASGERWRLAEWAGSGCHVVREDGELIAFFRDIADARAAVEAHNDDWRPMSEAPRNDTLLLVTNGVHICTGFWYYQEPQYGGYTYWRPLPNLPVLSGSERLITQSHYRT